ncbi:MAG: hypothetical protein QOG03_368 [Actinomycetota bacterium]|jgi:hypothetical protein|nr:hypothetical protein [Actinomycetota bacterium]
MSKRSLPLLALVVFTLFVIGVGMAAGAVKAGPRRYPRFSRSATNGDVLEHFQPTTYRATGALPALGGRATVYDVATIERTEAFSRLRNAFGFTGPVTASSNRLETSSDEGRLTLISVYEPNWRFESYRSRTPGSSRIGEAEAAKRAADLLSRVGRVEKTSALSIHHDGLDWQIVSNPIVGGRDVAGLPLHVTIRSDGTVGSASGSIGSPHAAATVPVIGTKEAIKRLARHEALGPFTLPLFRGHSPVTVQGADPPAAGGFGSDAGGSTSTGGSRSQSPVPGAGAVAVLPGPPVTRTVTGVRLGLALVDEATSQGHARSYLVPAYIFDLDNGGTISVLAVPDRYLKVRR